MLKESEWAVIRQRNSNRSHCNTECPICQEPFKDGSQVGHLRPQYMISAECPESAKPATNSKKCCDMI
jgi:hypothetical protein